MGNIVIATQNALGNFTTDAGASLYGDADVSWPLVNLKDKVFSKVWRYTPGTNADGNVARFAASIGLIRTNHLALCAHNLSEGGQIRLRAGTARFHADFTTDSPLSHDIVFGGGANGTRINEYGTRVAASGSGQRYEHDRRYFENGFIGSEDLTSAAWLFASCVRLDAKTVDFPAAGTAVQQIIPDTYADTYEVRMQVRLLSGNGDFCYFVGGATSPVLTATMDWLTLPGLVSAAAGSSVCGVSKRTAGGVLQMRKLQIRRGDAGGKYRKTTTQRRYQRVGILCEPAATNSLIRSKEYDNAAWAKAGVTPSANSQLDLDGTQTIDTLTSSGAGAAVTQDIAAGGTTTRALSLEFLRGGTAGNIDLSVIWSTGGVTQAATCRFHAGTGAFVLSSNTGATLNFAGVADLGGGYFRAYVGATGTNAANTVVRTQIAFNAAGTLFAGNSQNEANVVTSVIPTTTAALTRTVDTAVVEATTWVPYAWNAGEGTVYHEVQAMPYPGLSSSYLATVQADNSGSPGTDFISPRFFWNTSNGAPMLDVLAASGGVTVFDTTDTQVTVGTVQRQALRYRANDWAAAVNGATATSAANAGVPTINRIDLMRTPAASGLLRCVVLWPAGKSTADLQALTTSGPSAIDFDSGWEDVLQAQLQGDVPATWGQDYDILKTFPLRAVEWMRVELYDPGKTSSGTPFEIGRAFVGKFVFQPAKNAQYGMQYSWRERTTSDEAIDGRKFFNERPRVRELVFTFPRLTPTEADRVHEIHGSGGTSQEVLVLTDPDDEANCQRFGFVGYLSKLDPIKYPLVNVREVGFELEKKR